MLDTVSLDAPALDEMPPEDFVRVLDGVFERAPWVAEAAAAGRPYADAASLHAGLMVALRAAPEQARIAFLNGHPELTAGALAPDLTNASRGEQGDVPLSAVIGEAALAAMLREYRARHGIPFIVALRRRTPESIVRVLAERTGRDTPTEVEAALEEVGHVSRLRLFARLSGAPTPGGSFRLSVRADEIGTGLGPRVVLLQEGRPCWTGQPAVGTTVTILSGDALRVGHYAIAVEGWPDEALPRGAALRFAVRDPQARQVIRVNLSAQGVGVRLAG